MTTPRWKLKRIAFWFWVYLFLLLLGLALAGGVYVALITFATCMAGGC